MDSWCNRSREGSTVKSMVKDEEFKEKKSIPSGLVYLAQNGHLKRLKKLLPRTHVHEKDEHGACALHQASREGHVDVVTHLIGMGADVNALAEFGRSPLMYAAECRATTKPLTVLLAAGARVNDVDGVLGASALALAAQFGSDEAVELLVKCGANPLQKDCHGLLPVHRAAQHGSTEALKLLLETTENASKSKDHYADDKDTKTDATKSPIGLAPLAEIQPRISFPEAPTTPLTEFQQLTIDTNSPKPDCHLMRALTKPLPETNPDFAPTVNTQSTKNLATPLHCATAGGKPDNVLFLLNQGAAIDAQMKDGSTPLHISAASGALDVTEVLLDHGAWINLPKKGGFTPLATACAVGDLSTATLLLENGADAKVAGDNGWCPLHFAVSRGDQELVRLLLPHSDPNATTNLGDNTLLMAIKNHHDALAKILVAHCDPNHVENGGNTALHCAAESGNVAVMRLLLTHGAETGTRNVSGETPMQLAANLGHGAAVKLLMRHDKALWQEFIDASHLEVEIEKQGDDKEHSKSTSQGVEDGMLEEGVLDKVSDSEVIKFVLRKQEYTKL